METTDQMPAPPVGRDERHLLLREMAAVTRTIFGVTVAVSPPTPIPAPVAKPPFTAPISLSVARVPIPLAPIKPLIPVAVPALTVPMLLPDVESAERHSLALLQEIAFLDD